MQELRIGDTVIAAIHDAVARELVKAASKRPGTVIGDQITHEHTTSGSLVVRAPLEVVIELWPDDAEESGARQA